MAKGTNLAKTIWVLLFMFCVEATVGQAQTTYYVDANFTGGGRNGSATNPWQSLSDGGAWAAINASLAGGPVTVYFSARNPGSNTNETSKIPIGLGSRTDTSSNMLTLDGISEYNTNTSAPSWTTNVIPTPCKGFSCSWYTASKFQITSTTPIAGSDSATNCKNNFVIQGFTLHNTEGQSADLTYTGNLTFQYNDVSRTATGSYGPGVIVGPANSGPCNSGGVLSGPDNVTVQYNYIHATWGECIYVGASTPDPPGGNTACGSACHTGDNYLIQGNQIESCASWGGQGDGTDVKDGHTNLRVIGNTYRTSLACTNCGTQTPGNDGQGPLFESGALVDGNYIEAPGHQCIPIYASWNNSVGRGDMTIRNNICVNANSGVGSNVAYHLWTPSSGVPAWTSVHIYNNTAYKVGLNTGDPCIAIDSGNAANGATVENNIVDSCGGNGLSGAANMIGIHDYNEYFNTVGAAIYYGGSYNCSGLTGSEPHSFCGDPLFASTAPPYVDTNFELQAGSPAVGAGTTLSPSFPDYFGNTRAVPWDLAAIAQNTTGGPPSPPTGLQAVVQ